MRRLSGCKVRQNTLLLAGILDQLRILAWQNTADGQKGLHMPPSIVSELLGDSEKAKGKVTTFESGADFEAARLKILEEL